jgi:hypothetical protein
MINTKAEKHLAWTHTQYETLLIMGIAESR